jgi:hypothetical protein
MHRGILNTPHEERAAAAILLAVLATGCGTVTGLYSPAQLDRVGSAVTSADGIRNELGVANFLREDNRLWIYSWQDDVPYARRSFLVLEFDASGTLRNREVSRAVTPSTGILTSHEQYCTAGGVCIEHGIATDHGTDFDNAFSAVTVRGQAKGRISQPEPRAEECLLVIWPGGKWSRFPFHGVAVRVEDASQWSSFHWLPSGAYARIVAPAGSHVVSVRDPNWDARHSIRETPPKDFSTEWWLDLALRNYGTDATDAPPSSATVQCQAGEQVYLAVDSPIDETGLWFPITLRSVEATAAQALLADRAQVLPPD